MEPELIIGITFTGIGGYTIVQSARSISRGIDSEEWPKVQGEILETGIQSSLANNGGSLYAPMVRYRFDYDGKSYICDTISVGGSIATNFRSIARNSMERYHSKQTVTVSVCPDDPTSSVLEPGMSRSSYFVIAVGLLFFTIGLKYLVSSVGIQFPF